MRERYELCVTRSICDRPRCKTPIDVPSASFYEFADLLQSVSNPNRQYVGSSPDAENRLKALNAGRLTHTARFRPWSAVVVIRFEDDRKVERFERYLKSGSGHVFAKRHFW